MQASKEWLPPTGTLGEILADTRERVATIEREASRTRGTPGYSWQPGPRPDSRQPSLFEALRRQAVGVIAEVKRRSPSRGELRGSLDAGEQAATFERGGAAAISVLTEPKRFGGSIEDLRAAAVRTKLPLLKKDFHVSPYQLPEAGLNQASSVLLIARALPPHELSYMILAARAARLEPVVEVRSEAELETALELSASIIGVNARDLETLEVDQSVPERLIPMIPKGVVAIWESGIESVEDVRRAAAAGADAVLVGSALSLAADPAALLATMTAVPRQARRG